MDTQEIRRRALINAMHARCGGKQVTLAQQLGARADYVSRMLSPGRNAKGIGGDYAREIEQSLGLPPLWLDQPQNAGEHALVPATRANVTSVPVLEHPHHTASSEFWGVPLFAADIERAGYRHGTLRAAQITDAGMACMSGMRDYVAVVDVQSNTPTDGDIYLISHGNRLKLRRLMLDGEQWIARSDSPSVERYPDISVDAASGQIVGRMVWGGGFAI